MPTLGHDPALAFFGDACALVGSANFTDRGQTRNIEAGVLIEDEAPTRELAGQWRGLVAAGLVRRCPA